MATVTLAESAKLTQDKLVAGVIETIVDVNPIFELLPFTEIEGNSLAFNRENVLGDAQFLGVGGTITAKNPATFEKKNANLTTLIGDAEVNGLIQATRSDITNQRSVQVASKAKSIARKFQQAMITGDGTGDSFEGIFSWASSGSGQILQSAGANGSQLTFELLDELIDSVLDKDGQADFLLMPARTIRSYYTLLRALGGASIGEAVTLPSGRQVPAYRGVPLFRNDFIPVNQTQGAATTATSIIAGTFDDGSNTHGIAGLTAANDASGIVVENIGKSETKDEDITRVKMYCGFANFSTLGLKVLPGILN